MSYEISQTLEKNVGTGEVFLRETGEKINGVQSFETLTDVKNSDKIKIGAFVRTLGYYTSGDGGGNDYEIVAAGTGTDDGGSFIDLSGSGLQAKGLFGETVYLQQFGVETGSDCKAGFTAAVGYCVSNGITLLCKDVHPTISSSTGITLSDSDSLFIYAQNFSVTCSNQGSSAFSFSAPATNEVGVSSIDTTDVRIGSLNNSVQRIRLSSAPPASFTQGTIIKIVSEDIVDNYKSTSQKKGEFATVYEVDGNDLYLYGYLEDTYLTDVNVWEYSNAHLSISGDFEIRNGGVNVRDFVKPTLEFSFYNSQGIGLNMTSCYEADVTINNAIELGNWDGSDFILGYGVNDRSGCRNKVRVKHSRGCRHVTTTNQGNASAGSPGSYGPTRDMYVYDSKNSGNYASVFDTHETSLRTVFFNCTGTSSFRASSSQSNLFQIRDKDSKIISPKANGYFVDIFNTAGAVNSVVIKDPDITAICSSLGYFGAEDTYLLGGRFNLQYSETSLMRIVNNPRNVYFDTEFNLTPVKDHQRVTNIAAAATELHGKLRLSLNNTFSANSFRVFQYGATTALSHRVGVRCDVRLNGVGFRALVVNDGVGSVTDDCVLRIDGFIGAASRNDGTGSVDYRGIHVDTDSGTLISGPATLDEYLLGPGSLL